MENMTPEGETPVSGLYQDSKSEKIYRVIAVASDFDFPSQTTVIFTEHGLEVAQIYTLPLSDFLCNVELHDGIHLRFSPVAS